MDAPQTFETNRLLLRRPVLADAEEIFRQYARDPEVTRYLTWRPNRDVEETREFLRVALAAWEEGRSFQWVIVGKHDDQFLGMIGVRVDGHKLEMGYVLAKPHWGQGYMTEAVAKVIEWALKQKEVYRVWAVCDVENLASARVMEKAGMTCEGILRRWTVHPTRSEEPRDSYCYAIVKNG